VNSDVATKGFLEDVEKSAPPKSHFGRGGADGSTLAGIRRKKMLENHRRKEKGKYTKVNLERRKSGRKLSKGWENGGIEGGADFKNIIKEKPNKQSPVVKKTCPGKRDA